MTQPTNPIENFWDGILSSEPELIQQAFASLDPQTQIAVLAHLRRMVSEEGWHPAQQASARAALDAITNQP
jgi:hypothetical protein